MFGFNRCFSGADEQGTACDAIAREMRITFKAVLAHAFILLHANEAGIELRVAIRGKGERARDVQRANSLRGFEIVAHGVRGADEHGGAFTRHLTAFPRARGRPRAALRTADDGSCREKGRGQQEKEGEVAHGEIKYECHEPRCFLNQSTARREASSKPGPLYTP